MKYMFDVDAFRNCLDCLEVFPFGGFEGVYLDKVKKLLDEFPKSSFEIPPLIIHDPKAEEPHFDRHMSLAEVEAELDKIRKRKCPDESKEFGICSIE